MIGKIIVGMLQYLPGNFVWIFSKRYIAGVTLNDAVSVTAQLNRQGVKATMDLLGEFLTRAERISYYKEEYLRLIEASVKEGLDNTFSVKPTMFGLLLDKELCYNNIREIVKLAALHNRFVQVDMEDSQCTDLEIELYKRLHSEFPDHVGLVFQAYLKRTLADLAGLRAYDAGRGKINIRICKGIYNESPAIAYKRREEINKNFLDCLHYMFVENMYAAIATHDKELIGAARELIKSLQVSRSRYEFQMLYGVTPELRKSIVDSGETMCVYVPYGKDWFNYSIRRLRENPRMVSHIIKALFVRN